MTSYRSRAEDELARDRRRIQQRMRQHQRSRGHVLSDEDDGDDSGEDYAIPVPQDEDDMVEMDIRNDRRRAASSSSGTLEPAFDRRAAFAMMHGPRSGGGGPQSTEAGAGDGAGEPSPQDQQGDDPEAAGPRTTVEGRDSLERALQSRPASWWAVRKNKRVGKSRSMTHPALLTKPSEMGVSKRGDDRPTMSARRRRFLGSLYLAIGVVLVFSFAFFLESQKMTHYAPGFSNPIDAASSVFTTDGGANDAEAGDGDRGEGAAAGTEGGDGPPLADESARFRTFQALVSPSVTPEEAFLSTDSPQYRALSWLSNVDSPAGTTRQHVPSNEYERKKAVQRYVLAAVFFATNGPAWNAGLGFLGADDECLWNRVGEDTGYFRGAGVCDRDGMITVLALWENNLQGFIPAEIGALESLETLSLHGNSLRGPVPHELSRLENLDTLYLHRTELTGTLDLMCPLQIDNFRSDCGKDGDNPPEMTCSCCTYCCTKREEGDECQEIQST